MAFHSSKSPEVLGRKSGARSYEHFGEDPDAQQESGGELGGLATEHDLEAVQAAVGEQRTSTGVAGACKRTLWRLFFVGALIVTFFLGRLSKDRDMFPLATPAPAPQQVQQVLPRPPQVLPAAATTPIATVARPSAPRPDIARPSAPGLTTPRPVVARPTLPPRPRSTTQPRSPPTLPAVVRTTRRPKLRPTPPPPPALYVNPTMKLIVNSHVKYWKPLNILLKSMVDANWTHWDDVVIFMGGSSRDIPPYKGLFAWRPGGITIANMTLNNFDYNGFAGLYKYRDSPQVRADTYFYIHDSTSVGRNFNVYYERLRYRFSHGELRIPRTPSSNIYAFSHDLVEAYKTNYDVNLSKGEAVSLEWTDAKGVIHGVRPMVHFAQKITWLAMRQRRPNTDIYKTGFPRTAWYYPDYDLYKYILWDRYGDITDGKLLPNR